MLDKKVKVTLFAVAMLLVAGLLGCASAATAASGSADAASSADATSSEGQASSSSGEDSSAAEGASSAAAATESPYLVDLPASGFPKEGRYVDNVDKLPEIYSHAEKDAANAKANAPRQYTDRNGFLVQPVPTDELGWNNTYLNADNRGCTSCHTLEDALMSLPTYHRIILFGYNTEQSYQNCIACHSDSYSGHHLADAIHTLHMSSKVFTDTESGDCQSCHYINYKTGEFDRWDEVKYNLYKGVTDVAAEDVKVDLSYDQDTLTPAENRFFKTTRDEPSEWLVDDENIDQSIFDNWAITVDGDCENGFTMTLPEMVKKFGTKTQVMKMDCTINGVGQATIMQSEVTGIPVSEIIKEAKPKEGANILSPIGSDGYDYAQMSLEWLEANDALIITEMDGETLPPTQGYPCMIWVYNTSGGNFVKHISNLTFMTVEEDQVDSQLYVGQFTDDRTEEIYSKPNSGVLNYPTGTVFTNQVGKPIHLEGFADAWDEPIKKIEYSFDHGQTWTTLETPNNDSKLWTYWRMDFTPKEAGAYLLDIRTTSTTPEGKDRVCQYNTQFLMNVES